MHRWISHTINESFACGELSSFAQTTTKLAFLSKFMSKERNVLKHRFRMGIILESFYTFQQNIMKILESCSGSSSPGTQIRLQKEIDAKGRSGKTSKIMPPRRLKPCVSETEPRQRVHRMLEGIITSGANCVYVKVGKLNKWV